jgi:hypothetical protein
VGFRGGSGEERHGMGRAIFGIIMGALGTLGYGAAFIAAAIG